MFRATAARPAAPRAEGDRRRGGAPSLLSTVARVLMANRGAGAETMLASYYGHGFFGQTMANGQTFDMNDPTVVASPTLPFGTRLDCTYRGNSARVEVKDRGPYTFDGRKLDFSYTAALKLGLTEAGVDHVDCTVVALAASASVEGATSSSPTATGPPRAGGELGRRAAAPQRGRLGSGPHLRRGHPEAGGSGRRRRPERRRHLRR